MASNRPVDSSTSQGPAPAATDDVETPPTAAMSYSWDSDEHRLWVRDLAVRLRGDGVKVELDQWQLAPGRALPAFMERLIRENQFVLVVCTPKYKAKSDGRTGGVGYEGHIMTAEMLAGGTEKFIPILREGERATAIPTWVSSQVMVDLRGDAASAEYQAQYEELLTTLHGYREEAPPLGPRPFPKGARYPAPATVPSSPARVPLETPTENSGIRVVGVDLVPARDARLSGGVDGDLQEVRVLLSQLPSPHWIEAFSKFWNVSAAEFAAGRELTVRVDRQHLILGNVTHRELRERYRVLLDEAVKNANQTSSS